MTTYLFTDTTTDLNNTTCWGSCFSLLITTDLINTLNRIKIIEADLFLTPPPISSSSSVNYTFGVAKTRSSVMSFSLLACVLCNATYRD